MTNFAALIRWAIPLLLIELAGRPIASRILGERGRRLWLPLFFLGWTYVYWIWGTLFGLPRSGAPFLSGVVMYGIFFGVARFGFASPKAKTVSNRDSVFWLVFFSSVVIRGYAPSMEIAERYPDLMIFQSGLSARSFPLEDLWLSGERLNYYYFSQLLFVPFTRLTGVPPEWAFNLAVCTVAAFAASTAYAVVQMLTQNRIASACSAALTIFLGNWEWLKPKPFSWWEGSRAMGNTTITEFPFFSFLLGDFHAHFIAIPWLSLTLALLILLRSALDSGDRKRAWLIGVLSSLSIGAHYPINPWEIPIAALLATLILGKRIAVTAAIGVASFLWFLPFWLSYERPVSDIGWVSINLRSPLFSYLLHWAPFFAPLLVLCFIWSREIPGLRRLELAFFLLASTFAGGAAFGVIAIILTIFWESKRAESGKPEGLILFASLLSIAMCEFIHFDKLYGPELWRMNTVFKFYTIGWWGLAIAVPVWIVREAEFFKRGAKVWISLLAIVCGFSLVYPIRGFLQRREFGPEIPTLDGMMAWKERFPGEREAVNWVRANTKFSDVLFEATGPPYGHYARFSSFAGRPTVLGWLNHQGVWRRRGYEIAGPRQSDIDALSKNPSELLLNEFLKKYSVKYIVLGDLERKTYSPGLMGMISKLPVAFQNDTTKIFRGNE